MPKFSANLSFLYQDLPFLARFAAAAKDGFGGLEYLGPYAEPKEKVVDALKASGLVQALFNVPSGDWAGGERGISALPGREADFAATVTQAIDYARELGCPRLHAMAGIVHAALDRDEAEKTYVANLRLAADAAAPHGITVLIEPINTRDMPGYFLNTSTMARRIMAAVSRPNLKLQFDIYHTQIMEGDLSERLRQNLEAIGHIQIAGSPGRHEPDVGEINYPYLFKLIDEIGYAGWIGCEYRPRASTLAGLGWAKEYGIGG